MEVATERTNHDPFAQLRALSDEANDLECRQRNVMIRQREERRKLVDEYVAQIRAARSLVGVGGNNDCGYWDAEDMVSRSDYCDSGGDFAVLAGQNGALLVLRLSRFALATHAHECGYNRTYTADAVVRSMFGLPPQGDTVFVVGNKTRHRVDAVIVEFAIGPVRDIVASIANVDLHERPDLSPFFGRPWLFDPPGVLVGPDYDEGSEKELNELCKALHLHTTYRAGRVEPSKPYLWGNGFGGSSRVCGPAHEGDLNIKVAAQQYLNTALANTAPV